MALVIDLLAGGVLSVCFWPPTVEERGPWKRLADITPRFKPPGQWDADIPGAALLEGAELLQVGPCGLPHTLLGDHHPAASICCVVGGTLLGGLQDSRPAHEMAWPSVAVFWESMTRAGEPASPSACTTPCVCIGIRVASH